MKLGAKGFKFKDYLESVELLLPKPKNNACEPFNFQIDTKVLNTKKFLGKDELRPAMEGIHFSHTHKQYTATDAHRMYFVNTEFTVGYDIILDPMFFTMPVGNYEVHDFDKHILFKGDEIDFYIAKIDERYPDYKCVIPTMFNARYTYDKKELKELVKDALICANPVTNMIKFKPNGLIESDNIDTNAEFSAKAENFTISSVFDQVIGMNGKYLLDIIDIQEDDTIRLDLVTPNRAFIINDNCLLMPVMVNN